MVQDMFPGFDLYYAEILAQNLTRAKGEELLHADDLDRALFDVCICLAWNRQQNMETNSRPTEHAPASLTPCCI